MTRPGAAPPLQAALNGAWGPGESAAVPRDPAALAEAAAEAVAAGAHEVRLRPRTPCGAGSLSPRVVGPALTAVRRLVRVPVTVPADAWAEPDPERRVARVRSWETLPELAWVAWHEPGAEETAAALLARGVAVEAGLRPGTPGPTRFARSPLASRVRRIAVEVPPEEAAGAPAAWLRALVAGSSGAAGSGAGGEAGPEGAGRDLAAWVLPLVTGPREAGGEGASPGRAGARGGRVPVVVYGTGAAAWPVVGAARRLGLGGRIGLEDTLLLPDGTRARSTAEQVRAALSGPV
ncbi:3-keto-5-aminohexanoate cleavage protein [Streptomyces sp. NPDC085529]|uniref:3-keto-5-aminohexanoate cleavage protein n=1 Tax=Streptomyces sp. NPDC085529 TaxID=3365729 RepID=UPI0037D7DE90